MPLLLQLASIDLELHCYLVQEQYHQVSDFVFLHAISVV